MKKFLVVFASLIGNTFFGAVSHENNLEKFSFDVAQKRDVEAVENFLTDPLQFLEKASYETQSGDRILVTFYPKGCNFDKLFLTSKDLANPREFHAKAHELGFRVNFCQMRRFSAKFESTDQLQQFLQERFDAESISLEKAHCRVPAKIILAEIERL